MQLNLPQPAVYFAPVRGRYDTAPGLSPLGTAFGNGAADAHLFQFDREFARFRANKLACRAERIGKYVLRDARFEGELAESVCRLMAVRLAVEHPDLFALETRPGGAGALECGLTGETLRFDAWMRLTGLRGGDAATAPPYEDAFDALCCQVPEDVAVVALLDGEADANVALHVCAPSSWTPEAKIGASFVTTHAPVPHFEKTARAAGPLLRTILNGRPVVRFNWGVERTNRLNLHPEPPPNGAAQDAAATSPVYLRLERQTLWGLPGVNALLFAIRVYLRPATGLTPDERTLLLRAMRTLPPATRAYKDMTDDADIVACLESLDCPGG